MLYLLKGSRIREYHQQNLWILGAPERATVEISYAHNWIEPGLAARPGDGCVILFGDSPYDSLVPVRFATLETVHEQPGRQALTVRLGPYVAPGGGDSLTGLLAGRPADRRPGKVFLFADDNPGLTHAASLDEEEAAWRSIVDALGANGYFGRSVFARTLAVVDGDGVPIDDGRAVPAGEEVLVRLEVRTPNPPDEPVRVLAESDPPGLAELARPVEAPATGTVDVPLRPQAEGTARVALRFLPEPLRSSRPELTLEVGPPLTPAPVVDEHAAPSASEVARLVVRLEREARLAAGTWIGLFEDIFLTWAPDDHTVLEAYARHCYDEGRFDDAVAALGRIAQRGPQADRLLLLASLRARRTLAVGAMVDRIDFNAEELFAELLAALEDAPEDLWVQLLGLLPNDVLGDEKSLRFLEGARRHVTTEHAVLEVAEMIAFHDAEQAADVLMERWPEPSSAPEPAIKKLVELAERRNRLGPYLLAAVDAAARAGTWARVGQVADVARTTLADADRHGVEAAAARALLSADHGPIRERGFDLLLVAIDTAQRAGDLDAAIDYATSATAFAEQRGEALFRGSADEVRRAVEEAIEKTALFREYRRASADVRNARLRAAYGGRTIHLVGGKRTDWADDVRDVTGAAVEWHETEKRRSPTIDWADGLQADRDVVVVITDMIGHDVTTKLRTHCAAKGVRYLHGALGREAVLTALDDGAG